MIIAGCTAPTPPSASRRSIFSTVLDCPRLLPALFPPHSLTPFYGAALAWNICLGMSYLLIPLYAQSVGMSGVSIGVLVALPVLVQMAFALIGGALTDRLGGTRISNVSFAAMIASTLVFVFSDSFAGLLAGQILITISRAAYWPASWALASQFAGDRSRAMGRLNALTSAGSITGSAAAGLLIELLGFRNGFWVMALIATLALALGLALRYRAPQSSQAQPAVLTTFAVLLRKPPMWYALACAYAAGISFTLVASFYPLLFVAQGFSPNVAGWLVAMRGLGSITAGMVLARVVQSSANLRVPVISALVIATSVGLVAATSNAWVITFFLFSVGLASGVMTVFFQMLVTSISRPEQRGVAMSLAGLGFSFSHLTTPVIVGWLADVYSIQVAFMVFGAIGLGWTAGLPLLHRRAHLHRA